MSVCMSEQYSREGDTRHTDSNEVEEALQILTESFQKKYTVIPPYPPYRFPPFFESAGTVFRRLSGHGCTVYFYRKLGFLDFFLIEKKVCYKPKSQNTGAAFCFQLSMQNLRLIVQYSIFLV